MTSYNGGQKEPLKYIFNYNYYFSLNINTLISPNGICWYSSSMSGEIYFLYLVVATVSVKIQF